MNTLTNVKEILKIVGDIPESYKTEKLVLFSKNDMICLVYDMPNTLTHLKLSPLHKYKKFTHVCKYGMIESSATELINFMKEVSRINDDELVITHECESDEQEIPYLEPALANFYKKCGFAVEPIACGMVIVSST